MCCPSLMHPIMARYGQQAGGRGSRRAPVFRSAGVVDLSNPNDIGRSLQQTQPAQQRASSSSSSSSSSAATLALVSAACHGSSTQGSRGVGLQGHAPARGGAPHVRHSCTAPGRHMLGLGGSEGLERVQVMQPRQQPSLDPGGLTLAGRGGSAPDRGGVECSGSRQAKRAAAERRLASGVCVMCVCVCCVHVLGGLKLLDALSLYIVC